MLIMLELITWLKDGPYRVKVIRSLDRKPKLPSELADELNINRASISRILKALKEKNLVSSMSNSSRTVSYSLSDLGKKLLKGLQ